MPPIEDPQPPTVDPIPDPQPDPSSKEDGPKTDPASISIDPQVDSELAKARKEAAKYRTERNAMQTKVSELEGQLKNIAKGLGLGDDKNPDPEKLTTELAQAKDRYRKERLHNAYLRAAAKAGADVDLTWHVLSGSGDIDNIDVDGDSLDADMSERIKAAVTANPKLKGVYKPGGGGDQGARGGAQNQLSREALASLSDAEFDKAFTEGRFSTLLKGES